MPPRAKQSALALAILIVLATLYLIGNQETTGQLTVTSDKAAEKIFTVQQIKEQGTAGSSYLVDAYVVGKYECLPCLEDQACPACSETDNSIIIDSTNATSPETPLASSQLLVLTDETKNVRLGERSRFKIMIEKNSSSTEFLRSTLVEIISLPK